MVKWLSNIEGNKNKSLVPSTIITLFIVGMLILSGPAQAVAVNLSGLENSYTKGSEINFQVNIELNDPDQYVSLTNISLNLTGPVNKTIIFGLDGTQISKDCNIKIQPVSIPENVYGYGNGYGYDNRSGYGYNFGYGYGYGYGYGGGGAKINFIYNVTIDTFKGCSKLPAGSYSVMVSLNSGSNVVFQSQVSNFDLLKSAPGENIIAKVDIKPETINLASKGTFTAFINLNEEYDVRDINVSSLDIMGAHAVSSKISNESDGTLIAKFNTQDLVNVHTGNEVKFNVTGEVDGVKFVGSDTVKVIDNKDQKDVKECECDKPAKDDDHEGECDDQVKEHENQDNKVKDHSPEKNKEDNKKSNNGEKNKQEDKNNNNNGGQGKTVVINNIYINDNSGTVNVNINNQGSSTVVNQGSNSQKENNGNSKNQGNNGGSKGQSNNKGKK